jgi:hypothetical protein
VTIFFLFGSVFGRLFSLCLGIEIWKLSGFYFSDLGVISRFSQFFSIVEDFVYHQIIWVSVLFGFHVTFGLGGGSGFSLQEGNVFVFGKFGFGVQPLKNLLQFSRLLLHTAILANRQ